jgi:hypothetical protein
MISCKRPVVILLFCLFVITGLVSCTEKKEGKVIVIEQEFSVRQDAEYNWVIDAKGKIRNVGDVDVKKVVVTGYCRSCGEILTAGRWFINDIEFIPKTPEQKDVISYLSAGDEEEFSFREVAFYFHQSGQSPGETLPDSLEVIIESFETVGGK